MASIDLRSPGTQKGLLGGVAALGVLGVFFLTHFFALCYPNQTEKLNSLKAEYEKKSTELARARASVADLPRFEAEYDQLHERWIMAAELLPADKELPTLLRKVTLAAEETGCRFVTFRPGATRSAQYYSEMPMQISITGDYHAVGSFLAELANMRRIITVSGMHLKPTPKSSADKNIGTTAVDFVASAFSLNGATSTLSDPTARPDAPKKEGPSNVHKAS
ncbi:MAG: type 4a pilus biogenesis protein PilO [Candidatus Eiseniibacteriota bacterium]